MNDNAKDFYWMSGVTLTLVDPPKPQDLRHYGVKGMKWGVRKKDDLTGRVKGQGEKPLSKKRSKQVEMVGSFKSKSVEVLAAIASALTMGIGGVAINVASEVYGERKAKQETAESRMLKGGLELKQKKKELSAKLKASTSESEYIKLMDKVVKLESDYADIMEED